MKFSSKFFNEFKDTDIFSKVAKGFGFLFCCVPSDPETSMIALLAFRSIGGMDEYTKKLKVNLSEYFDILHIIPFSIGNLLVFNPTNVLKLIVDSKKIEPITSLEKIRQM